MARKPKKLGGFPQRLAPFARLSKPGLLGNVYAPLGGFEDSPLAGGLVETESVELFSVVSQAVVAIGQPVFEPAPEPVSPGGGGDGGSGGGPAGGDGGSGDGGSGDGGSGDGGSGDGGGAAGDAGDT